MKVGKRQQKSALPFRIGVPAYVFSLDIMDNVHKLKDKVDNIELILPEANNTRNVPRHETLKELNEISRAWNLTYTIHLPLDIDLGSPDPAIRKSMVENAKVFVGQLSCLKPRGYILHLNLPAGETDIGLWRKRINSSLQGMAAQMGDVSGIAVENLSYPFNYVDRVVSENKFSICVDIGHLICMGVNPLQYLKRYFGLVRVIHLHGVNNGKDHVSLKYFDIALLKRICSFLKERGYSGVITIEIFSQSEFDESMSILREILCM
jgi:sugar phosphate isomerase/epimerase